MGADSAISTKVNGVSFRISNEGKKIWRIDDMIIFSAGDVDLSKIIMDEFEKSQVRNMKVLKNIIKFWFERYYKRRPGVKEKVDNGGLISHTLVAKYEDGSPVLYEFSQENEFEINKIKARDKIAYYTAGVNYDYDNKYFIEQTEKANDVFEAYRNTYSNASNAQIGGNLELYVLAKQGIRKILNEKISENQFEWAPRDKTLRNDTDRIKEYIMAEADLIGNRLTLRDGDGVMKMFPKIGFWAGKISEGSEDFDDAAFSVDLYGNLKAHKAKFYGKAGELLIDTENGVIDLDKFDMINVGKLMAEMLEVNTILADDGYVNNLTVNRVKTIGKDSDVGQFIDFEVMEDNYFRLITAQVQSKAQAKDSRDRLLYWLDNEKRILTTDNTGIIAYSYKLTNEKIKHEITFEGSGDAAQPVRRVGTGDGGANDRAKFVETKYNGGLKQEYKASNNARERSIDFKDEGLFIKSEAGQTSIESKEFRIVTDGGNVQIGLTNGTTFEMTTTGDVNVSASRNMNFEAAGNMKFRASRIDLN
ncbi:hypothetical protein AB3M99_13275 [Paenibacillus taichungensis]